MLSRAVLLFAQSATAVNRPEQFGSHKSTTANKIQQLSSNQVHKARFAHGTIRMVPSLKTDIFIRCKLKGANRDIVAMRF